MNPPDLQNLCEIGQQQLMTTDYLSAEQTLVEAEALALKFEDWDTLARLYMPLQEARRQRRQRCGEGVVRLDLVARSPSDTFDAEAIVAQYPHGQLLVAGWETVRPAIEVRRLANQRQLYLEAFLAVASAVDGELQVTIFPFEEISRASSAYHLNANDLPPGAMPGSPQTYARVMGMWETLHAPLLAEADRQTDLRQKIAAYRQTIRADYACELAHQKLSNDAHQLAHQNRQK